MALILTKQTAEWSHIIRTRVRDTDVPWKPTRMARNVTRYVPEDARARSIMLITQVSLPARNKPIHRMALAEIRLRLLRERSHLSMSTSIMLTIHARRPVELPTDREGTNARSGVRGKWNSVTCVYDISDIYLRHRRVQVVAEETTEFPADVRGALCVSRQ